MVFSMLGCCGILVIVLVWLRLLVVSCAACDSCCFGVCAMGLVLPTSCCFVCFCVALCASVLMLFGVCFCVWFLGVLFVLCSV